MQQVLVFSFTAMANPTLLAATTVLLLLPSPKKLMLGATCSAHCAHRIAVIATATIGSLLIARGPLTLLS